MSAMQIIAILAVITVVWHKEIIKNICRVPFISASIASHAQKAKEAEKRKKLYALPTSALGYKDEEGYIVGTIKSVFDENFRISTDRNYRIYTSLGVLYLPKNGKFYNIKCHYYYKTLESLLEYDKDVRLRFKYKVETLSIYTSNYFTSDTPCAVLKDIKKLDGTPL